MIAATARAKPSVTGMLIGDAWIGAEGRDAFEDRDPATGALLARLPEASSDDVDRAVGAARAGLAEWTAMGGERRGRLLVRLADALEDRQAHIASLESADNGRPLRETGSQARIVARWYRYFAGLADKIEGATIPVAGPYLSYTRRVPVGVCAAITPWNHPLLIATKKVAPALACGNTVVLKPSELAPLSVLELGRLALAVGFPPGVVNIVTGGRSAGAALAEHPGVDRVDFTGSTATGRLVGSVAGATMKRFGLELGGKAANIVFADADRRRSLRGAAFAAYVAQGQSCVAGSRVLVEASIAEDFAARLAAYVEQIRVGDPLHAETQMGPLITPGAAERTAGYVREAVGAGARVLTGGSRPEGLDERLASEGFYAPTLLWVEDPGLRIAQEEVFGPVATVIPFRDEADAVRIANDVPFGLGGAVWTGSVHRAHRVADALRAGIVWINDYHRIDPASPWGGFGLSGVGRENGLDAIHEYTSTTSVWLSTEPQPMDWYDSAREDARLN
jgi:acyl-CoA reductase-like NAD-dependent aldehyde dehydrogenase